MKDVFPLKHDLSWLVSILGYKAITITINTLVVLTLLLHAGDVCKLCYYSYYSFQKGYRFDLQINKSACLSVSSAPVMFSFFKSPKFGLIPFMLLIPCCWCESQCNLWSQSTGTWRINQFYVQVSSWVWKLFLKQTIPTRCLLFTFPLVFKSPLYGLFFSVCITTTGYCDSLAFYKSCNTL